MLLGVEQNKPLFFRFAVTSDLCLLPATNRGLRLPADMGAGGTGIHLASGERCQALSSHSKRVVPPPFTCINLFCWSFIFVLTSVVLMRRTGSVDDAGSVIHWESVFRNISHMKEKAQ